MCDDLTHQAQRRWWFFVTDAGLLWMYRGVMALPWIGRGLRNAFRAGCVLGAVWLVYVIRQEFVPSDWVDVTVRGVPPGTQQIYLVAEQANGVHALGWYESMVSAFVCSAEMGQQWRWTSRYDAGERIGSVQWPNARRYGALLQAADRSWVLIWFGRDDLQGPSLSRYVFGDGKATVRIPVDGEAVIISAERAKQIGVKDDRDQ